MTLSEEKNDRKKKKTINKISPLAKRLIKKANIKTEQVHQSALDIAKLNYLYYLNKPSNSISNKSFEKKSRNNNYRAKSVKDENKNKNIKDISFKDESDLIKKIRNKSLLKNFVYINNNYHKQLNSAFMKYNPTAHLNNMKILLEAVPSFHNDISREKKEVENDIDFRNDKFKFKKKYLNYMNKQNLLSLNKPKIIFKPNRKKNLNKSVSLPKIKLKGYEKNNNENKKLNIPMLFINKLKKNKGENFQKYKQNKINELNKLVSISGDINNLIGKNTLEDKIKIFVNDYNLIKLQHDNGRSDIAQINLNKIDYFKSEKQLIDQKLKSFYLKKYFNSIDKKEKNSFNKLRSELDIFANNNINDKDNSLNELDNYLMKNNIDILE